MRWRVPAATGADRKRIDIQREMVVAETIMN
jgi:hypothetical protein